MQSSLPLLRLRPARSLGADADGEIPRRRRSGRRPGIQNDLVEAEAGRFTAICRSCSQYRSIYDHRPSALDPSFKTVPLDEAIRRLDGP